jgi:hypothetical protein
VSKADDVTRLLQQVMAAFGTLDVLVRRLRASEVNCRST